MFVSGLTATAVLGQSLLSGVSFADPFGNDQGGPWFQARVQQRIIIRFPSTPMNASVKVGKPIKYKEEKIGKCLLLDKLVASRPDGKDRLELVTRDRQLIRAYLGDGCLAREFYAGAYVEKSADGKLCVDRDLLHARTGAKCEVEKFRLMVAENK